MVGDNAQGDILFLVLVVLDARYLHDVLHDVLDGVDLEEVVHALHDAGEALKTHTGIDIAALEAGIVIVAIVIKLSENEVPELNISVAVAADSAGRRTAAVLLAAVEIELRAGTAGACAVLPEVILFTETNHMVGRNAELLRPDVEGLVVVQIDAPGVVAYITKCLSELGINIAFMRLFRESKGYTAYTIVESDDLVPEDIADTIRRN